MIKKEKNIMVTVIELKKKVIAFWSKEMQKDVEQIKFIKIEPTTDGWSARVQITEENEYFKKLGRPPVFDRNIYETTLNSAGEIIGFCLEEEREKDKGSEEG
ncbi:MAG: hypothetical protein WCP39_07110 [Chlamydiota bacterium]